ncbi:MAG: D-glycero-beta-D-manno-heptose 1,7-bisphosphate 7-phosphatase [Geobacter sp.]|nr:D-glycero-beta-D-manno-heptose 1,7-bisphosphate 7-phosphatase [Geobacter sp.]
MTNVGKRRAVFLDRDGTINVEKNYLHRIEDFEFIPGAASAIKRLNDAGFLVIVVTNQSGVARGYYEIEAVHRLHAFLDKELAAVDAHVDAYYVCPHHPEEGVGEYRCDCHCRKPMPGMLLDAARKFGIDLAASFMIGDKLADVEAAVKGGCKPLLVLTGHGADHAARVPEGVPVVADIGAAVEAIVTDEITGRGEPVCSP